MSEKLETKIENKISTIVEELGFSIEYIEFVKEANNNVLRVVIDKNEGLMDVDDCEKVNDAITDVLDELNPTNDESYTLNVSSPGLDRPIKSNNDFLRNKGKIVEVCLYTQVDKKKKYQGLLDNLTDDYVCLIIDNKPKTFERKNVSKISPVIEF